MEGDVGNLEGGEKAEDDSGENGNEQGETEGGGVEVDGVRATSIEQSTSPGRHTVKLGKRRINQLVIDAPRL